MNNHLTCDPNRIEQFLQQQLSDEEQAAFELHLDNCHACQLQLESSAASEDVWSGVQESLNSESQTSLDPISSEDDTFDHNTVLNLLAPTDDDRMIGRLGTYEVLGVIGSGGMGVVLKAFDASLNRYVAIKVLAPHLGNSGSARKRFSREAQAAAAVVHDNVIEVHGVADAEGLPYLVMPYVKGPSLQRRLDGEGPLALAEVLRIGMQAASGLAAAHAQGLVHRDVKPANILLADGIERVKLTDFGLARAADDASLTRTGIIAGTPQYMSPEQARGESFELRSDLFSLGSVLYTMCTGRAPFRAETSYGVLRRITDEEPRPIREINPNVPDWLCGIIAKLMSKQPDDRFKSASEVAKLLEECLAHVQQPTVVTLPVSQLSPQKESVPFAKRKKLIVRRKGIIAMLTVLAIGVLGMAFLQATEPPEISGRWHGEGWGQVSLKKIEPGKYQGTYTDTFGDEEGHIQLKWSRIERRLNGTWQEGKDRFGKISVRLVDKEVRGAWTTNRKSGINPGTPELADLLWTRKANTEKAETKNPLIGTWKLMVLKQDGGLEPHSDKAWVTFDNWKMTFEYEHEEDAEQFLYKLQSDNSFQFIPVNSLSLEETRGARYKLIDQNNLLLALSPKGEMKPPSTEPNPQHAHVTYLRFVRVQRKQEGTHSKAPDSNGMLRSMSVKFDRMEGSGETNKIDGNSITAELENPLIGVWQLAEPQKDGSLEPSKQKFSVTFDNWKMTCEYEHEEDTEYFLYNIEPRQTIQLTPVKSSSDEGTRGGRFKFIDHNNLWLAIAPKGEEKPPLSAEPNPKEDKALYLPLVRVDKEQKSAKSQQKPQSTTKPQTSGSKATESNGWNSGLEFSMPFHVRQAKAALHNAKSKLQKAKELHSRGFVTKEHLESLEKQVAILEEGVEASVAQFELFKKSGSGSAQENQPSQSPSSALEPKKNDLTDPVNQESSQWTDGKVLSETQVIKNGQTLRNNQKKVTVRFRVASAKTVKVTYPNDKHLKIWKLSSARSSDQISNFDDFSVQLSTEAERALKRFGIVDIPKAYLGKEIEVTGTVSATGLNLFANPDTIWFYHIVVKSLDQIRIVNSEGDGSGYFRRNDQSRYFRDRGDGVGVPYGYDPDLGPASGETKPLSDAIGEFNQRQKQHPNGKGQPPLTEDEVVASIRWAGMVKKPSDLSGKHLQQFREIAKKRSLPSDWRFEFVTELDGVGRERFEVWSIRLVLNRQNGKMYSHNVRTQHLWQLDLDGGKLNLPEPDASSLNIDAKPLTAAIHGFNQAHTKLNGIDQPPLTEREVIAAIRWWKILRNEVDATNGEFAALQDIADKRLFPTDAKFEITTHFQPGDGFDYFIWSVRLSLPKLVNAVPYPRYGITIRKQFIRSEEIDGGKVSWGPVAANGLQAGVKFEPHQKKYKVGQQVTPRFFYRYSGDQEIKVAFPRLMTRSYYGEIILDYSTHESIPLDQEKKPGGPVGWQRIPFKLGSQYDIRGLPIVLGDVERGDAKTVIRAMPGQSVRVRFVLTNYATHDSKPLQTGDIVFSMGQSKAEKKPNPAQKSQTPPRAKPSS
ncbi:Serine/threonine-protein kinase PrkC [Symmachiella macrocystis]|uniref:non-specific serine/threonine protein kinase n=1 Tax=Symmachiella macrocystis TaxID=2527985 RepID=A0A5C6BK97_9PLAN|nr:serine/threonine-protein kinase [Symmachiella macrocystis]TWU12097.1 Serine/threonine-protein kinase PrkC [Symmachiella macrocystis]